MGKLWTWVPMTALLLAALLCGCGGENGGNQQTLALREAFLSMESCSGSMEVTADYGQRVYEYTVEFSGDGNGGMNLVLTAPEEVAGITAHIAQGQTALEFDGVALETGPLNQEGLSPLDALPAFVAAMQTGYLAESGSEWMGETEVLRLVFREPDRNPGQGMETVLWFDKEGGSLRQGELRSDGYTVVRCGFPSFALIQPTLEEKGTEA